MIGRERRNGRLEGNGDAPGQDDGSLVVMPPDPPGPVATDVEQEGGGLGRSQDPNPSDRILSFSMQPRPCHRRSGTRLHVIQWNR